MDNHETKRTKRKLSKRAAVLYGVLALCMLGVGAATYFSTSFQLKPQNEDPPASTDDVLTESTEAPTVRFPVQTPNTQAAPEPSLGGVETQPESGVAVAVREDGITRAPVFSLPLSGATDKTFSNGDMVQSKTMGDWRVHNGVDFRGTVGDPVKAINNGVVKAVYDDVLWGTVVEIDHGDGLLARYCGFGKGSTLHVGDVVKINDKVGNLGTIPIEAADPVHLHLELKQDGKAIDPMTVFAQA